MALQAFFPNIEPERIAWLNNYRAKIAAHGLTLGLSADEIANTQADIDYYVWMLHSSKPSRQPRMDNSASSALGETSPPLFFLAYADGKPAERPAGVLTRLFAQIAHLKIQASYTEAIGRDLGIVAHRRL
jgi:hypothetical protein